MTDPVCVKFPQCAIHALVCSVYSMFTHGVCEKFLSETLIHFALGKKNLRVCNSSLFKVQAFSLFTPHFNAVSFAFYGVLWI